MVSPSFAETEEDQQVVQPPLLVELTTCSVGKSSGSLLNDAAAETEIAGYKIPVTKITPANTGKILIEFLFINLNNWLNFEFDLLFIILNNLSDIGKFVNS